MPDCAAKSAGRASTAGSPPRFGCTIEGAVDEDRVRRIAVEVAEAGADAIILADTVGYGQPAAVERVFRQVIADVAPLRVRGHFHDTRGLGLANVLAALNAGARAFDASLGGLGGCPYAPGATGNIVIEDLAFMLEAMGFETGIDLDRLVAVRDLVHGALPSVVAIRRDRQGRPAEEFRRDGAGGMSPMPETLEGGCSCGAVRYRLNSAPMFVHCCHCRDCQRQTGAAFAVNALIESDRITLLSGEPQPVGMPTDSGRPHRIYRCPTCRIALWSEYGGVGKLRFVRVGTLDDPDLLLPDVHIYTRSKLPWVALPSEVPAFEAYYSSKEVWPAASLERRRAIFG